MVPVKPPRVAKSRLSALGGPARAALAEAFAADTVAAVLQCRLVGAVLVVTDDRRVAEALDALGAGVVPDERRNDLNGSLRRGAAELARSRPELRPVVVCADLPALRPDQLARALDAMPGERMGLVADVAGVGTTVLAAPSNERLEPRFGPGSRAAHLDVGAADVDLPGIPGVRRDVDTPEDLTEAVALGVGPRTAFVLGTMPVLGHLLPERADPTGRAADVEAGDRGYGGGVQATVASYDAQTRAGTVILDDGHQLSFAAGALEGTGLRLLRPGQRVRLATSGRGGGVVVDRLQILTLR